MGLRTRDLPDKVVWLDADLDHDWHHTMVRAISFNEFLSLDEALEDVELVLDIDFLHHVWLDPEQKGNYSFMIAPATLVFENVFGLAGDLWPSRVSLEVEEIRRSEPEDDLQRRGGVNPWVIDGHDFSLSFLASGFRLFFRARPIRSERALLFLDERGGISFERPTEYPDE